VTQENLNSPEIQKLLKLSDNPAENCESFRG